MKDNGYLLSLSWLTGMMVLGLALQTEVIEGKEAGLPHHFSGNTPKHTSPRDKATSFQFLHFTWSFINNIFKYT